MMSIDLFKEVIEYKYNLQKSYNKSVFCVLYNLFKLYNFITKNIIKTNQNITYQFIYNFINFTKFDNDGKKIIDILKEKNILITRIFDENNNLYFSKISILNNDNSDTKFIYEIYPNTSPGEIRFEYILYLEQKEIHEQKTFINSLELDPHKDNLYTSSAKYFKDANSKMSVVINFFFKYYINECATQSYKHHKILKLVWRNKL